MNFTNPADKDFYLGRVFFPVMPTGILVIKTEIPETQIKKLVNAWHEAYPLCKKWRTPVLNWNSVPRRSFLKKLGKK